MADIEQRLRSAKIAEIEQLLRIAMHAAVDGAETSPDELIRQVIRRRRRHTLRSAAAAILAALGLAAPAVVAVQAGLIGSSNHGTRPVGHLPTRMTGLRMPSGTSFQFIVTTPRGAGWYSTATRKITPITGLPSVVGGYRFWRADGGWFLESNRDNSPCPQNQCAGPPIAFYLVADGSHAATLIGRSFWVASANQASAVWLVTYPHVRSGFNVRPSVQLMSSSGAPLSPRYRITANHWLVRAVGSYLLIGNSPSVQFQLWDPRTGRVVRRFTNVLAAGPNQVAWDRGCAGCRSVLVTNISTGSTTSAPFPLPETNSRSFQQVGNLNAGISDDGKYVALQQVAGGRLAVVNTATGVITRIPGTALSAADWQNFYWQDGGHRLVITAGLQNTLGPQQIAYWQPDDPTHLYVTTITNAAEQQEIVTGAVG
jgi:hypothetical protein